MPHDDNRTLAIRALNAVRPIHVPTYIATRVMADSSAGEKNGAWGDVVAPFKYGLRGSGRFCPAPAFKGLDESGENVYREFHIPSPSTLFAEASALSILAGCAGFQKPSNVFSYRWPKSSSCPYNFEHFMNGFRLRQENVSKRCMEDSGAMVVSLDVERFYPSINRAEAIKQFERKLSGSEIRKVDRQNAQKLVKHLCTELEGDQGIPTGPEFSHLLADCAFTEFDAQFANRFGENYLRYVDDFIFIVPPSEADAVVEWVGEALGLQGYGLHAGKEDRIGAADWVAHVPQIRRKVGDGSFEALVFKIKVFLSAHPKKTEQLRQELRDLDFRIPLQRLIAFAEDRDFREKLKGFARGGWKVLWSAYQTTIPQIVLHARAVRKEIERNLDTLLDEPLHPTGLRRRWQIQQLRYNVNRAVYMLEREKLKKLAADLGTMPEFLQFRTLVQTIFDGDSAPILKMPGATASSAGALLRSLGKRIKVPNETDVALGPELAQAISTLLAYDVVDAPERILQHPAVAALRGGQGTPKFPEAPFTFFDEHQMLMREERFGDLASYLDSRFSSREALVLEALELDERGYS